MKKLRFSLIFISCYFLFTLALTYGGDKIKEFKRSFAIQPKSSIIVNNVNGDIKIQSWKNNSIDIYAKIAGSEKEYIDNIEIKVERQDNTIKIKTNYIKEPERENLRSFEGFISFIKRFIKGFNSKVDYYIKIPYQTNLDKIENVNGDIIVNNINGYIKSFTVNGNINIENFTGEVKAETVNGSIKIILSELKNDIKCETVNGGIDVYLPENINARIFAENINGAIDSDFPISVSSRIINKELRAKIGDGGNLIRLETVNGNISILKKRIMI